MNIIKQRQEERRKIINQLSATIKKVFESGLSVDKEKLLNEVCFNFGFARRTALEYLQIALTPFNSEETKSNGRVVIIKRPDLEE